MHETRLLPVLFALVVVHFNRVGVAQWCAVDKDAKTIQCNYESEEACEGYREKGEFCRSNPFFVEKKNVPHPIDKLKEPKHVPPKVR